MMIPILNLETGKVLTEAEIGANLFEIRCPIYGVVLGSNSNALVFVNGEQDYRYQALRDFDNIDCPECGESVHVNMPWGEDSVEVTCSKCSHDFEAQMVEYLSCGG